MKQLVRKGVGRLTEASHSFGHMALAVQLVMDLVVKSKIFIMLVDLDIAVQVHLQKGDGNHWEEAGHNLGKGMIRTLFPALAIPHDDFIVRIEEFHDKNHVPLEAFQLTSATILFYFSRPPTFPGAALVERIQVRPEQLGFISSANE
jgi:hypothetical protein